MRWSKLFIPTLREEPAEGDPRLRLLVRAGYARFGGQLFLGRRSMEKIGARIIAELRAQEIAMGDAAVEAIAGGDLRSYKQLPQVWASRRDAMLHVRAVGRGATEIENAIRRALTSMKVEALVGDPEGELEPEPFHTPGVKTIAEVSAFTGLPETSQMKSVVMSCGGKLVLVLVRGDHTLSELKLRVLVGSDARAATAEEIRSQFGADPGSLGPVNLSGIRILADEALRGRRKMICGANRDDYHLKNVTPGRDFEAEFADLRAESGEIGGDGAPVVSGELLLGSVRPSQAGFTILNENGVAVRPETVSVDLGLDRVLLAAARDRDESGLVMPPVVAPFSVVFVPVNGKDEAQRSAAEQLYEAAKVAGCDAVLDDRDERPGVKFKDHELTGIPWRVTVGKRVGEGFVEVFERKGKQQWDVALGEAVEFVRGRWDVIA